MVPYRLNVAASVSASLTTAPSHTSCVGNVAAEPGRTSPGMRHSTSLDHHWSVVCVTECEEGRSEVGVQGWVCGVGLHALWGEGQHVIGPPLVGRLCRTSVECGASLGYASASGWRLLVHTCHCLQPHGWLGFDWQRGTHDSGRLTTLGRPIEPLDSARQPKTSKFLTGCRSMSSIALATTAGRRAQKTWLPLPVAGLSRMARIAAAFFLA
eukprot:349694-Chlamydomonas_euryale.AAC.6